MIQALAFSLRRSYATLPDAASAARTASTPRAVRLRRLRKRPAAAPGQSDSTPSGLTPTELARYQRLKAIGGLVDSNGTQPTEEQWLEKLNARRTRIRGVKVAPNTEGEMEKRVVGQKVYLPNFIFRMVRNHTPLGEPYNPYEATFRIPQSVTKTDVRSYLSAVYGVKTTYIRTDNYLSPLYMERDRSMTRTKSHKTYKRAVVGLVEPFYYPLALEDMDGKERAEREKWIEDQFKIKAQRRMQQHEFLRMTKAASKGWSWRTGVTAKRSTILKNVWQRRLQREEAYETLKKDIIAHRERGDPVMYEGLR